MARVSVEAVGFLKKLFGRPVGPPGGNAAAAQRAAGEAVVLSVPDGTTVEGLVRLLADIYPDFGAIAYDQGRLTDALQIVVGDRLLELAGGWQRILADEDNLVLLPPFEGG